MYSVHAIFNHTTEIMKLLLAIAILVLVLVSVQWEMSVSGSDSVQCREEERLALLHINASIHFPIHSLDGKWEGKECCRWERVTCDPISGHVTQLQLGYLSYNDDYYEWADSHPRGILLNATLFLPLRQLTSLSLSRLGIYNCTDGAGFESWSNLTELQVLDLSNNGLPQSIISSLSKVSSLRALSLNSNDLFGDRINDISVQGFESWSNLTELQVLDLSENELPQSVISSISKVSSLRELYLDYNFGQGDRINDISVQELSALNLEVVSLRYCNLNGSTLNLGHWSSLKALSLEGNSLNDTLSLEGLCRLKNLEELDLSDNSFIGILPPCLGNLSSLKLVNLKYNQFQIKFPSIFDRLVSLRYLDLSYNQFEGILSMRSFQNHSNLEVLRLSTNIIFQVEVVDLPFQLQVLELANCIIDVEPIFLYSQYKLRVLDLSNTGTKGPLSAMWLLLENNTNLIKLDLQKNFFTGPLQLPSLTHEKLSLLDISDNLLDGELPANITIMFPNLLSLTLSKNNFQGSLPLIPTRNLQTIDLSNNNLTDDIQNTLSRIQPLIPNWMDLSNNQFYGSITNHLNFTRASKVLLLNDNNISGEIPFLICNTSFEILDISNNELNGVLPNCIGGANLWTLKLSGNQLEGSLPTMCIEQNHWLLDLSDNRLSGSIPHCSNDSALQVINVRQNNLTGNFPTTWLNISEIYAIDIGENYLSGELPSWNGMESNLCMLLAGQNLFRGLVPKQICQFKYLGILDLSHNDLSGEIPSCIKDMGLGSTTDDFPSDDFPSLGEYVANAGVVELNFSDANFLLHNKYDVWLNGEELPNFAVEFISKGRLDSYLVKVFQIQCILDLSSNNLVGNIPEDIGRMNWLITLNLSNNHLNSTIPNSISNLHQLESLDLSHNSLTGKIPLELTKLTSLEYFTVAYNNLSSPTLGMEAQFSTFTNSSYEGNPNLCGPPLSKSCVSSLNTTQPSTNEMSDSRRDEGTDFLILFGSFSLFFVVSFWCFMVVLYFKRNWRYTLFTLVDHYSDIIYGKVVLLARKIGAA